MKLRLSLALAVLAALFVFSSFSRSQAMPLPQSTAAATSAATESAATAVATVQPFTLINLNTATEDQLLAIPNMNNRMVREFQEYRPYTSILQFHKEIAKYVGDDVTNAYQKFVYVPIKVDEADAATLQQIPGIDEKIAADLIAARPYKTNDAFLTKLATVLTADQVTYAQNFLEGFVPATPAATMAATSAATQVPTAAATQAAAQPFTLVNLNTATADQLLAIPNMNNRMVREFQEYRPYTSILQFHKEIAKYVGDDVTNAYQKFVYVPVKIDEADAATLQQIPGIDEKIAADLIAARPYKTNDAFLTKLATVLTADQVIYAKNFLETTTP